jgi:hypothetical protein
MIALLPLPGRVQSSQYGDWDCGRLIRLRHWLAFVRHQMPAPGWRIAIRVR